MGNYLRVATVSSDIMATTRRSAGLDHPTVVPEQREPMGVDHLTVVPENYQPPAEDDDA
jgi:hypothetical protein